MLHHKVPHSMLVSLHGVFQKAGDDFIQPMVPCNVYSRMQKSEIIIPTIPTVIQLWKIYI